MNYPKEYTVKQRKKILRRLSVIILIMILVILFLISTTEKPFDFRNSRSRRILSILIGTLAVISYSLKLWLIDKESKDKKPRYKGKRGER